jgi:hypothetical protein
MHTQPAPGDAACALASDSDTTRAPNARLDPRTLTTTAHVRRVAVSVLLWLYDEERLHNEQRKSEKAMNDERTKNLTNRESREHTS